MLADIPPEIIRVVVESMQEAGLGERETGSTTLVMALSDHVANAVERVRRGIDITYPLLGEVSNLYPQEYAQGRAMLASLNARLDVTLPDGEATALAMHLVNAGFATGDLSYTYTMTGVIQQLLDIYRPQLRHHVGPQFRECGQVHHPSALPVRTHPPAPATDG